MRSRITPLAACLALLAVSMTACGQAPVQSSREWPLSPHNDSALGLQSASGPSIAAGIQGYLAGQTRTAKARLIERLTAAPKVVIFGGSRAMRIPPAYISQRTGLSAFNAAVTQARPEDTWALLNLLHARFPAARFRFLWVVHGDEFDPRPIDLAILLNPGLARYFPVALVKSQLRRAIPVAQGRGTGPTIDIRRRGRLVYAANGFVLSGFFGNYTPPATGDIRAIDANIRKELLIYGAAPAALYPRSVQYFRRDLALMDRLAAAPPVIVAAPFDQRIYAATADRGWGARHRLLLDLLGRLHLTDSFRFLDMSRAGFYGFVPSDFYDGIHLTPQGGQRLVDVVLSKFPRGL